MRASSPAAPRPPLADRHVCGPGEPLLAKPFIDFLGATNGRRFPDWWVHLTTNGTLLDAERLALLEGVPVATFIVSLPAASARICERVSGHHRFEIVVSNLRRLRGRQHAFEQRRPLLQQRFVLRRAKPEELPALLDLAAERRARLQRVPLERDQHNAAEALSQRQATLERAVEPLDALGDTWQRHERTVHQLRSVRRALELQQPHQNRV